ncbi:MAG: PIG-L family deacetylase [Chloroflexi bacterium]|nr:PIG-L family deacetylase [Chloroflexota bacterium]MCI0900217.1 PIG-L family deacetylase [Chloroflexota bacterium]
MPALRLLACLAHPDDEAFPVGGLLALNVAKGRRVRLVTTTLGEEGEIRQEGSATRETLGEIRRIELSCAVRALSLESHTVLDYRDSGMAGWDANDHPRAYIKAPEDEVVERLVREIREFRPQVVLTFEPGGLYGHPDHIAVSKHTTQAFEMASDPAAFPGQLTGGLRPHTPQRLFYSARPQGFRLEWANRLRAAGEDFPLPSPEQLVQGTPLEEIHLELDISDHLETKMACILCHRTQVAPSWPYHRVPRDVAEWVLGREYYIRARPGVASGETVPEDLFEGINPD